MNRSFSIAWTLVALALVMTACQGALRPGARPTSTPVLLASDKQPPAKPGSGGETGGRGTPAEEGMGSAGTPVASSNDVLTTLTPAGVESAESTPTPGLSAGMAGLPAAPRLMALGLRPSIALRSSPDSGAPIVAVLPGSEVLWAQGSDSTRQWLWVSYGESGRTAWVPAQAVSLFGEPADLPVVTPEPVVALPETAATSVGSMTGRVTAERLNVRDGPSQTMSVIGQLTAGQEITVTGRNQGGDWLAIDWHGRTGWVAARYIEPAGRVSDLPVIPTATQAEPSKTSALPGKIVFQTRTGGDIYLVNADGSGLRRLTDGLDPTLSPDGTRLAYVRWNEPRGVFVLDLRTGQEQRVATADRPRSPTWSPDGNRLAFARVVGDVTCRQTPFGCLDDATIRQRLGGQDCVSTPAGRYCIDDFPVVQIQSSGLTQVNSTGDGWADLPAEQTVQSPRWHPQRDEILYRGSHGLQLTAPQGTTRPFGGNPDVGSPAWSPDGQRFAAQVRLHDHSDIFLLDAAGNMGQRLTAPASSIGRAPDNVAPTWSPDGRHILFLSNRDGAWRLYLMNADGSGQQPFLPDVLGNIPFGYDFAAERMVDWAP